MCGELKSESTFNSHELMANNHTVLFTASKRYFYSCEYCAVCTQRVASLGRWLIGTYDINSERVNILHRFQTGDRQRYSWSIRSVVGSRALMQSDSYYFLELPSNQLTRLSLDAEFAQNSRMQKESAPIPQLLDEEGTFLITQTVDKKITRNTIEYEYWVRHPDGKYQRLGIGDRVIHQADTAYLWNFETHRPLAYSLKTRTLRSVTERQDQTVALQQQNIPEPNIHVQYQMSPSARLHIGRRFGKDWNYKMSTVTAASLKW